MNNKLILGDCLEVMKKLEDESIDLIYLDPPFFSNRNYEVIWGDAGEIRSFEDRWSGGIDQYINWLYDRVKEMHRLLKPTGSIYLHCDWHADAYIRVQILDKIFGSDKFRGNVIWKRTGSHSITKGKLPNHTDTIFYYSKTNKYTFEQIYTELRSEYVEKSYNKKDAKGKYRLVVLTGGTLNPNDKEWRGYDPKKINRNWSVPREIVSKLVSAERAKTMNVYEKLDLLYENGYIEFSKNGTPNYKRYLELSNEKGIVAGNLWNDVSHVHSQSLERIGYPTQKPLALLERIIKASSNEGDVVLDPFMGGGTTMVMASRLGRNFIGIDQSIAAVDVTDKRLQSDGKQLSIQFSKYEIEKHYYAEEDLKAMPHFEFETWIVQKFGGKPNAKQVGDFGSDGEKDGVPLQVKRWKNKVGRVEIQKFFSVCHAGRKFKENKEKGLPVGYFIAFDFAKEAVAEMARLKMDDGIIIEKVLVSDIVPMAKRPIVRIEWSKTADGKYEFRAISDSTILNYSWDFAYAVPAHKHDMSKTTSLLTTPTFADAKATPPQAGNFKNGMDESVPLRGGVAASAVGVVNNEPLFNPTVLRDNVGVRVHNFASNGTHNIAVKVVDNKYLENIAVCSISI